MLRRCFSCTGLALAIALFASCDGATDPTTDADCLKMLQDPQSRDAFDWLKAPSALSRQTGGLTTDGALALAHRFESLGARRIIAVGNRPEQNGPKPSGPSSEGLVIELPGGPRNTIFQLYAMQVRNDGRYGPQGDNGQKYLFVPWPHRPGPD